MVYPTNGKAGAPKLVIISTTDHSGSKSSCRESNVILQASAELVINILISERFHRNRLRTAKVVPVTCFSLSLFHVTCFHSRGPKF
jgi:hypothetical protein